MAETCKIMISPSMQKSLSNQSIMMG